MLPEDSVAEGDEGTIHLQLCQPLTIHRIVLPSSQDESFHSFEQLLRGKGDSASHCKLLAKLDVLEDNGNGLRRVDWGQELLLVFQHFVGPNLSVGMEEVLEDV